MGAAVPVANFEFAEEAFIPTVNGQTVFTLALGLEEDGLQFVFVNGVVYQLGVDYTLTGTTLTWLDTDFLLDTTDCVLVKYQPA